MQKRSFVNAVVVTVGVAGLLATTGGAAWAAVNWNIAQPATFTSDVQSTNPSAGFNSVSCTSAGNCTAAGSFKNADGYDEAFTQTSTNGVWADAVPATFADGVQNTTPSAGFTSVSCTSAGNCTAAGSFMNAPDGYYEAFTQTSTNGVWADAVRATFATGVQSTNPDAGFTSVSCTSAGNCTAAGKFKRADGYTEAFTQTSTNGVWADAQPATFATDIQYINPGTYFSSVSCTSAGNCTAAGRFRNAAGEREAFTQTSTNGIWADAQPATFATDVQNTSPDGRYDGVSCTSAGNCTAAGGFKNANGDFEAFTQTSTNGVWADGVPATFATGIQNPNPYDSFVSVSCTSAGNCTAAGRFKNADGDIEAFTRTSTNGVWADGVPATFATDVQNTHPYARFTSASCTSAGKCTAAGSFKNANGDYEAFTQTSTTPALPPTGSNPTTLVFAALALVGSGLLLTRTRRRVA